MHNNETSRGRKLVRRAAAPTLAAMLVLGTAVAVFEGRAPIGGGAESSPFSPQWEYVKQAGMTGGGTCTATTDAQGKLTLNMKGAYPGSVCTVDGAVLLEDSAAESGKVTGLALTVPQGWTAKLAAGCGATVPRGSITDGAYQGVLVSVVVTMTDQAAAGSASTFAAGDGVRIAPLSANAPVSCTA